MSPNTTLRFATIGIEDGRGNVVRETVTDITTARDVLEKPMITLHALDQCLGNRKGVFDIKGMDFVALAWELELAFGSLSAELRTSQGVWRKDKNPLRAKVTYSDGCWTHELIIVDTHDSALEKAMSTILF